MNFHWWWVAVCAAIFLWGDKDGKTIAGAFLGMAVLFWAATTGQVELILAAVVVAVVIWTAAAWKYLGEKRGEE